MVDGDAKLPEALGHAQEAAGLGPLSQFQYDQWINAAAMRFGGAPQVGEQVSGYKDDYREKHGDHREHHNLHFSLQCQCAVRLHRDMMFQQLEEPWTGRLDGC